MEVYKQRSAVFLFFFASVLVLHCLFLFSLSPAILLHIYYLIFGAIRACCYVIASVHIKNEVQTQHSGATQLFDILSAPLLPPYHVFKTTTS